MANLIVGFPSFLAQQLLAVLRQEFPSRPNHLLVLPEHIDEARKILGRPQGVSIHRGSASSVDLGLSAGSIERLLPSVKHIFYFGLGQGQGSGGRRSHRRRMEATRQLLRFASECHEPPRLMILSSLFVLGQGSGVVNAEAAAVQPDLRNGLESSLLAQERLVISSGLSWTLLRPGLVIGDSRTGHIDRLGGIYRLGILASQMPKGLPLPLPSRRARVHAVAADTLAVAAARLASSVRAHQRFVVIDHPQPLPSRTLVQAIAERNGLKARGLAAGFDLARPFTTLFAGRSQAARDFAYLNDTLTYRADTSDQLLRDLDIEMPPPAELMRLAIKFTADRIRTQ